MTFLRTIKSLVSIGTIAVAIACVTVLAQAAPNTMRVATVKVYLSCKLSPTAENLALALAITNSTKLTIPSGATVTYTQALGQTSQYHTVTAASAIAPGGTIGQTVAHPYLTGGPCTAWFMSAPMQSLGTMSTH